MDEILSDFEFDLKAISRMSPLAAVNYIRQGVRYDQFLAEYAKQHHMKQEELTEIADELAESAAGYHTFEDWEKHIEAYTAELAKRAAEGSMNPDAVTLATMHSAKGLEFPIVYIIDCIEGVVPHAKAVLPDDIEEERRLFYVAMTRAKRVLRICAVRERFGKPAETSRFIHEYLVKPENRNTKEAKG
jgi:DNA helicase-2/ATP-dependent DNA helicase PcrA